MIENVDHFTVAWDDEHIHLIFTNVVDEGEEYWFSREDARLIRDALTTALADQHPDERHQPTHEPERVD